MSFITNFKALNKDYYDALLDIKRDVDYVTISWNYFHDSWKCSLSGSSETDTYDRTVTYHHNYYENINSRLPLFRSGHGHVFNNYYKDIVETTINSRINACVKIENNYFQNANNPYVTAYSDVDGYGDISGNILVDSPFEYTSDERELMACTANIPYNYADNLNCADIINTIVPQFAGINKSLTITYDCNGDINGTAYLDDCDVCVAGQTGYSPCTETIEAEEACDVLGVYSENTNPGFSGSGYVNTDNEVGAYVLWTLDVDNAQSVSFTFKFANGGTTSRSGDVFINDQLVTTLALPSTGGWDKWQTGTIKLDLNAGLTNLKIQATTADGLANIDLFHHSASSLTQLVQSQDFLQIRNLL